MKNVDRILCIWPQPQTQQLTRHLVVLDLRLYWAWFDGNYHFTTAIKVPLCWKYVLWWYFDVKNLKRANFLCEICTDYRKKHSKMFQFRMQYNFALVSYHSLGRQLLFLNVCSAIFDHKSTTQTKHNVSSHYLFSVKSTDFIIKISLLEICFTQKLVLHTAGLFSALKSFEVNYGQTKHSMIHSCVAGYW